MSNDPRSVHEILLSSSTQQQTVERIAGTRALEIIFYGMACFVPQVGGYRVLFPNGLTGMGKIPIHLAAIWVRDRDQLATARWAGHAVNNDFFLHDRRVLTITGLVPTPLDATGMAGRLTDLVECDSGFTISPNPDAAIDMIVDQGKLTAHFVGPKGMSVVKWVVQAEASAPVRFYFGDNFVEVPPTVTQVMLANVGGPKTKRDDDDFHFRIYRKLSTEPDKELEYKEPKKGPLKTGVKLKDPTMKYGLRTPDKICSPTYVGTGLSQGKEASGSSRGVAERKATRR